MGKGPCEFFETTIAPEITRRHGSIDASANRLQNDQPIITPTMDSTDNARRTSTRTGSSDPRRSLPRKWRQPSPGIPPAIEPVHRFGSIPPRSNAVSRRWIVRDVRGRGAIDYSSVRATSSTRYASNTSSRLTSLKPVNLMPHSIPRGTSLTSSLIRLSESSP